MGRCGSQKGESPLSKKGDSPSKGTGHSPEGTGVNTPGSVTEGNVNTPMSTYIPCAGQTQSHEGTICRPDMAGNNQSGEMALGQEGKPKTQETSIASHATHVAGSAPTSYGIAQLVHQSAFQPRQEIQQLDEEWQAAE